MSPVPIDLRIDGLPGAISSYLLTEPEPALVDPGPSTTLDHLREGLEREGLEVSDLRRVLLTHVHLDHAGATGHLLEVNPDLRVHVHEDGAHHLVDPERLVASTRRSFGDAHDRLWGEVLPVPRTSLRTWRPGARDPLSGVEAHATPGHIAHHVAYLHRGSGVFLSGDCMGIILGDGAPTHPPTPPPSLDLPAWYGTLHRLKNLGAERVGAAHFGIHGDFEGRRRELERRLRELETRVRRALEAGDEEDEERFQREVVERQSRHLPEGRAEGYFGIFPASMDWKGTKFHLERSRDA